MSKILYVGGNYKTIPQLSGTEFKVEYVHNCYQCHTVRRF